MAEFSQPQRLKGTKIEVKCLTYFFSLCVRAFVAKVLIRFIARALKRVRHTTGLQTE